MRSRSFQKGMWTRYITFLFILVLVPVFWTTVCCAQERVSIGGNVTYNGTAVTAMVLANGKYMFTSRGEGRFDLVDVPLDSNGRITLYAFCSGLSPYKTILDEAASDLDIQLTADNEASQPVVTIGTFKESESKAGWFDIAGTITNQNGIPLCAMVLANGQYMFTCSNPTGEYALTVPVDSSGQVTIYGFCSGFLPFKEVIDAYANTDPYGDPPPAEDYTEEVGGVSFDMVYIPGGTFTLGCQGGSCPADTNPVPGVTVSSYHIAKKQVTAVMWEAVMGESMGGMVSITWYDAMRFACELGHQTGRAYRMMTEAEFEYAAKNYLSSLEDIGENSMFGEEWAYNSWDLSHMGGTDPVGPNSGKHTQKTRRDIAGSTDNITGRLIRSIDGIGPQLRLVVSNEMEFPPHYIPPCELTPPVPPEEPENSYRDPRWITGSDAHWKEGAIKIGNFDLRAWEDGTAVLNGTSGQWFTSNNIAFVFVPSSGSIKKFAYIWLDETQGTLISDAGFYGGYTGRIEKMSASSNKPTISGLKSGAELAAEAGDDYKMVDMENIPEWAKEQDQRLIDGPGQCWFQDNSSVGGLHHYRKDVDADEFRFTVNQGQMTMLANGNWFTVNNTFLRITHPSGYTTDYLYTLSPGGIFFHNSYQAYERADFRLFQKKSNSDVFPPSCGSHCNQEIPKGEDASIYSIIGGGESTYVPAPCPADGCD